MTPDELLEALIERIEDAERRRAPARAVERVWGELADRTTPEALAVVARWMAAQLEGIGAKGFVFGASGGVDSSLVAVLVARAAREGSLALILPCGSDPEDEADARALLDALGLAYRVVPIEPAVEAMERTAGGGSGDALVRGNLAARVRATLLYHEANRSGRLVVGTGDLDESYIGYSTKGTTADLFPITGLHKDEVRALLRAGLADVDAALGERLAGRPASPGFWRGQDAEAEIGLPYARLAAALDVLIACCSIEDVGIIPKSPEALREALEAGTVTTSEILAVADLIKRNYHKSFGSPALWRP